MCIVSVFENLTFTKENTLISQTIYIFTRKNKGYVFEDHTFTKQNITFSHNFVGFT